MQRSFSISFMACALIAGVMLLAGHSCEAQESDSTEFKLQMFAVEIKTGPNWDASKAAYEQAYFSDHSENLKRLRSEGHIVMGARYSDIGLIIIAAESAEDVAAMLDEDASMTAGTFVYEVHAINIFYPYTN